MGSQSHAAIGSLPCQSLAHLATRTTLLYVTMICWQRSHIFQWDGKPGGKWLKVDVKLELPKNTILEVEFVQELRGEVNPLCCNASKEKP